MTSRCNQTKEEKLFDKDELLVINARFLADLRYWHSHREIAGENPRAVRPEYDVRYRRRDVQLSSGCSSSAGWDWD